MTSLKKIRKLTTINMIICYLETKREKIEIENTLAFSEAL